MVRRAAEAERSACPRLQMAAPVCRQIPVGYLSAGLPAPGTRR